MPERWEQYLNEVVSYVRFRFDRGKIRTELLEHMEDLYTDLRMQGIEEHTAIALTVEHMGDAAELGKALDRAHTPVLGYIWLILGGVCAALLLYTIWSLCGIGIQIATGYAEKQMPASDSAMVYAITPDLEGEIYEDHLSVTQIVYDTDGHMGSRLYYLAKSLFLENKVEF